jgi:hypothetical protein
MYFLTSWPTLLTQEIKKKKRKGLSTLSHVMGFSTFDHNH